MKSENKLTILTFTGIVIYYLAIMFQGFDVCDEGFALSSYQQIFNAPESIEYNMLFWLTTTIGGIWYNIFPNGGIISFRILGAITVILTMLLTQNILKDYLSKKYILIGILMIMVSKGFGVVNFSYNTLSGFMSVLIMFFLFKGLINEKLLLILFAGVFTAMITFASLPAFSISALILVIPFYEFINNTKEWRPTLWRVFTYILGIILGIAIIFFLMKFLGHLKIYKDAISMITKHSIASDSNHNLFVLLKKYIIDYIGVIKIGAILLLGSLLLIFIQQKIKRKGLMVIWFVISLFFYAAINSQSHIFPVYFISISSCLFYIFDKNQNPQIRLIAFGALVTAIFLPLGTDPGIHSIGHASLWISLPFFFSILSNIKTIGFQVNITQREYKYTATQKTLKTLLTLYISAFFFVKLFSIINGAYFDPGSRLHKTASINCRLAKGIHTTPKRAEIINEAINKLTELTVPNDYLLVYDKMPMLHYFTHTKPYTYNPWTWAYDSYNFDQQLRRAEKEIEVLPIIFVQKFETIFEFSEPIENYLDESAEDTYLNRVHSHKSLKSFLSRNQYEVYWENEYYCIYKTR
ncbi:hypothetical protein E9993_04240 [Labilibacter sediminis]|nr:hypothetical protein E9993_04240 [Labilibacter sediminis]